MNFSNVIFPALLAIVLAAAVILGLFLFRRKLAGLITGMARRVTSRFATAGPVIDACEKPLVLFIAVLGFYFGLSILAGEFVPDGLLVQTRTAASAALRRPGFDGLSAPAAARLARAAGDAAKAMAGNANLRLTLTLLAAAATAQDP